MDDFEKRWQRIADLLQMEATGNERPVISSKRTLFGIKSDVEIKMDAFAKQIEEENTAKRKAREAAGKDAKETAGTGMADAGMADADADAADGQTPPREEDHGEAGEPPEKAPTLSPAHLDSNLTQAERKERLKERAFAKYGLENTTKRSFFANVKIPEKLRKGSSSPADDGKGGNADAASKEDK